jgi:dCMP deaminase
MKVISDKWSKRFLRMAYQVASWSKDQSSQVGSVIVDENGMPLSFGYNGMPRGVNDDLEERHQRPEKYNWFEHAERNAIYQARRSLEESYIFVTHPPCPDCARGIIQSGIRFVTVDSKNGFGSDFHKRMVDGYNVTMVMFKETGIVYRELDAGVELYTNYDNEKYVLPRDMK